MIAPKSVRYGIQNGSLNIFFASRPAMPSGSKKSSVELNLSVIASEWMASIVREKIIGLIDFDEKSRKTVKVRREKMICCSKNPKQKRSSVKKSMTKR